MEFCVDHLHGCDGASAVGGQTGRRYSNAVDKATFAVAKETRGVAGDAGEWRL